MKAKIFVVLFMLAILAMPANAANLFHVDKSGDKFLQDLINNYADKFTIQKFTDESSSLALEYNIYFPEDYSPDKKFPVVFFIADGSSVKKGAQFSLQQGCGGLVWCKHSCVVIVPFYNDVLLDDHGDFVVSDYVELTAKFISSAVKKYNLDSSRVYATGQSMGCMTFLLLASKYQDLFAACLFVSGQWDISKLEGLRTQKFIYAASMGDDKASTGQAEVIKFFRDSGVNFTYYCNVDAKKFSAELDSNQAHNFITFKAGTTLPDEIESGAKYSEHMSSFDYVYKIEAVIKWLLAQSK